ncbi:hypothetical protein V5F44_19740 [Xanthobacter sp. V2C-8]|uniref:hypothetical protein n=1 Tax=Xanthobacter albus TaxID=3119929 RepID=UPI00372B99CC
MAPAEDTRDRVIRLEAQVEHMAETVERMARQLEELHTLLQQARGARWLLVGVAMLIGAAGGFLAKLGTLLAWIPK